jgi:hypothetical protein
METWRRHFGIGALTPLKTDQTKPGNDPKWARGFGIGVRPGVVFGPGAWQNLQACKTRYIASINAQAPNLAVLLPCNLVAIICHLLPEPYEAFFLVLIHTLTIHTLYIDCLVTLRL